MEYAAFLRAINVGGRNLPMARLQQIFESIGLGSVRTVIASGNVVFESDATDPRQLRTAIEQAFEQAVGWRADTFLRTREDLERILREPPFAVEEIGGAESYVIAFLHAAPDAEGLARLAALSSDVDRLQVLEREVVWLSAVKQSRSALSGSTLERALRCPATLRGAATVQRVLDAMDAPA